MKSSMIYILIISLQLFSVNIDGYAFLGGETDHSGIEIFLQKVAPDTLFANTAYTDSLGYYSIAIEEGWYDVYYSKINYTPDSLNSVNCYSDVSLDSTTLIFKYEAIIISGSLSGVLESGVYDVVENLSVESGNTLIIEPGTELFFRSGTEFMINGELIAQGTETDSIVFTSDAGINWEGLYISNSNNCELNFCRIENSVSRGIHMEYSNSEISNSRISNNSDPLQGAGMYITYSNILLSHTDIEYNSFTASNGDGAGVFLYQLKDINIQNCKINNNNSGGFSYAQAVGVMVHTCNGVIFNNCQINNNTASDSWSGGGMFVAYSSNLEILNSEISSNTVTSSGGGLYITQSDSINVDHSNISSNTASSSSGSGGGIYIIDCDEFSITNSDIISNYARKNGGGICIENSDIKIENIIFSDNNASWDGGYGAGIFSRSTTLILSNSIFENNDGLYGGAIADFTNDPGCIYNNLTINNNIGLYSGSAVYVNSTNLTKFSNCIITNNLEGDAAIFNNSATPLVENCLLYNNEDGNFYNCGDFIGVNVTTNANADSCDAYYNISMDPQFADAGNGDFRLQTGSPCIDAGTNAIDGYEFPIADLDGNYRIWDGDGNGSEIVDMGVYEFNSPSEINNEQLVINNYILLQNYPNPFNPETLISYNLINNAQVNLKVYDIRGREVCSLVNQKQNKGLHEVKFDGSILTSGIYFYRLSLDGKSVANKKMMLLK